MVMTVYVLGNARKGVTIIFVLLVVGSVLYAPIMNGVTAAWTAFHSITDWLSGILPNRILAFLVTLVGLLVLFFAAGLLSDALKRLALWIKFRRYSKNESRVVYVPDGAGGQLDGIIVDERKIPDESGKLVTHYRILTPRFGSLNWPNPWRPEGSFTRRNDVTPLQVLTEVVLKSGIGNGSKK
ncbi:MAG: hypothetical protein UY23_C0001G0070 [Candidatus Jorgensenbacteria bacterium GW2011_GWA1_48_11]|uniref:Uncharacterized protein n=1 Tax=Candidatus Jorgensenbacteria bacterium GW2011_GWA1_48_11 TaxID=1618660 RepID=A0A0G1UBH0_9BACT|nr:MAG: hypothetical protein UY23_C0001G0070 [Candidatus Jorgensenbacteria bacterium GW2011_GWA1_48_11]KKW11957.1 MAG: hypothetical protein UY51_C0005G0199 [Candidatus Jorgensenbacteria bacterium GW2011_GWB1_49_9]